MTHPLRLSPRASAVLSTVTRYRQVTASQLLRLHFVDGTPRGRVVRCHRTLARLVELGLLSRLTRARGGYGGGSGEYIYQLPTSKTRGPNFHTLDITEIHVRLFESDAEVLAFDGEPWCHISVGHMELKPDFFVRLKTASGVYQTFGEVDHGSEYKSQLSTKMRRYVRAFNQWDEPTFPLVVWVCHDADRQRFIQSVIKRQEIPSLFVCYLFSDAIEKLCA
jgi:hypothetical protein